MNNSGKRGTEMDDLENKSNTAADTRKVYEAPALESLGSLESHTQNGPWANGRLDRSSS